jgi:hypothetical protein
MRVEFRHTRHQARLHTIQHTNVAPWLFALCIVLCGAPVLMGQQAGGLLPAQASDAPAPHLTLVFLAQHRMTERAWAALFAAVRAGLPEAAAEVPALNANVDANVELIRGDTLAHGVLVPQSVTVFLRGDCNPSPVPEPFPGGAALGWVVREGPQIVPTIHVECTAIGQEISERTERLNWDGRTAAMSEAMARVILHEWAHIATQSSAHGAKGITKAQFGVNDLVQSGRQAEVDPHGLR